VGDGLLALALATAPPACDVLSRPPRRPEAEVFDQRFLVRVVTAGGLAAGVALAAFAWELHAAGSVAAARNAAFSVLVVAELLRAFSARSATRTVAELGARGNARLLVTGMALFTVQLLLPHAPPLRAVFHVAPVSAATWLAWGALATLPLAVLELAKLGRRRMRA
jgi:Ca2+-transporting ATPase